MAQITFKGTLITTTGELPATGGKAPRFNLVDGDLKERSLEDFPGQKKVVSIVPSLDTGVCATSTQVFHERVGDRKDTALIIISADLPFAQKRFCDVENLAHIHHLSTFRNASFGTDYGVTMADGPLSGLLGRAVLILDENNTVLYSELVPEITQEPDYDLAIKTLNA